MQFWKDSGAQIAVQDALFANLGPRIEGLKQFVEPVKQAMVGVNTGLNQAVTGFLDFVNSGRVPGPVTGLLKDATTISQNFSTAIGNLGPEFPCAGACGHRVLRPTHRWIRWCHTAFQRHAAEDAGDGRTGGDVQARPLETGKQVLGVFQQVAGIIAAVVSAAAAAGGGNALGGITEKLKTLNAFLSAGEGRQALITFFQSAQTAMGAILPILMEVIKIIGSTLGPIIANIATNVGTCAHRCGCSHW